MAEPVRSRPDVLVLGAGGTLGIAWLRGLLVGLEETSGVDFRRCEYLVGTSAGAFVAAALAGGHRVGEAVSDPGDSPDVAAETVPPPEPPGPVRRLVGTGGRLAASLAAPFVPLALTATRPGGEAVRALVLRAGSAPRSAPPGLRAQADRLGARFDGRLRIAAVDRARGSRVVFGAPGEPPATVTEAVQASCAVPWLFAPVPIGDREYVDGGVWSLSNLDVAPTGRGSEVLALLPTAGHCGTGGVGVLRAAAQAAALAELQVLRARGARARILAPDRRSMEAMGTNLMDSRRRDEVFEAAVAQGRRLGSAAPTAPRA